MSKQHFVYTMCSELVVFLHWTCNSMNNLSSYCGLDDARISASDKDLPVQETWKFFFLMHIQFCVPYLILTAKSILVLLLHFYVTNQLFSKDAALFRNSNFVLFYPMKTYKYTLKCRLLLKKSSQNNQHFLVYPVSKKITAFSIFPILVSNRTNWEIPAFESYLK